MNPSFLDSMSWEMAEVYGAITDRILINLAGYFPYFKESDLPISSFAYQSKMLAQLGKVNDQTIKIIRQGLSGADDALERFIEQAIIESVKKTEPELLDAVKKGLMTPENAVTITVSPNQTRAFQLYYRQAADKLNLVNTTMLESTRQAYQATVNDIVTRIRNTQTALDIGAGEVITGVSTWNQAVRNAINRMTERGITGFIDHAGHRWSAEAYAAMDIRTTFANTARAAVWETNQNFGNDLYQVSFHIAARPLCYPWQCKVISATNKSRTVKDLYGNDVHVYAQSETTYGEPAGLFGINCGHYPMPFIPGVSTVRDMPETPEENEEAYKATQKLRRMERKIREQKRDLKVLQETGAPPEEIDKQKEKIRGTSADINDFCNATGQQRRRDRESVYTKREFPSADTYDVTEFERTQKETIEDYYKNGGEQQGFNFGTLVPLMPFLPSITPEKPKEPKKPKQPAVVVDNTTPQQQTQGQNVASQVTKPKEKSAIVKDLETAGIERRTVGKLPTQLTEQEIIAKLAGADQTKGSCASVALAYTGNKNGLDVTDFRGGTSQSKFSKSNTLFKVLDLNGVVGQKVTNGNDFTNAHTLLSAMEDGKEYFFTAGRHAAIVRKTATGFEYLEMQSGYRTNTWYELNDHELRYRFGCQRSHTTYGMKYQTSEIMFEVDSVKGNEDFAEMLEFLNTATDKQRKGIGGGEK